MNDLTEFGSATTAAATIVFIQKWLKTKRVYAIFVQEFPGADKWAHRFVGAVGAIIAAAGIHITFNYNADVGGTFSGTIPSLTNMVHGLYDWYRVYIFQHAIYSMIKEPAYQPKEH